MAVALHESRSELFGGGREGGTEGEQLGSFISTPDLYCSYLLQVGTDPLMLLPSGSGIT